MSMEPAEQRRRMLKLRSQVRRAHLGSWLQSFVAATGDPVENSEELRAGAD